MMTSAQTRANLARFVGISHQRIGRYLLVGQEGGAKHEPSDPDVIAQINTAFEIHSQVCKDQAETDNLPFNAAAPTYAARLWKQKKERVTDQETGEIYYQTVYDSKGNAVTEPGDRVSIEHTHWLSNRLRNFLLAKLAKSGRYLHASVGSLVNLVIYHNRAEKEFQGRPRTDQQKAYRSQFKAKVKELKASGYSTIDSNHAVTWVFTKYIPMDKNVASDIITDEVDRLLRQRHEPATGFPNTALAAQILLQTESKRGKK